MFCVSAPVNKVSIVVKKETDAVIDELRLWGNPGFSKGLPSKIPNYKEVIRDLEAALKDPKMTDEDMRKKLATVKHSSLSFLYSHLSHATSAVQTSRGTGIFSTSSAASSQPVLAMGDTKHASGSPAYFTTAPAKRVTQSAPTTPALPPRRLGDGRDTRSLSNADSRAVPVPPGFSLTPALS